MKRRILVWVLAAGAAAPLAFVGVIWSAHRRADEVFARHDRDVQRAIAEIRARPSSRQRLYNPALPGDGWPVYLGALAELHAIPDADILQIPLLNEDSQFLADREKLREVFEKYAPRIEDLRKSIRHEALVPRYPYEQGLGMEIPNIPQSIRAAKYLSGLATFLQEGGQAPSALDALLLGIAVGHESGRSGCIINHLVMMVCEGVEAEGMREMLAEHSFKAPELESFARNLDRLWEGRPTVGEAYFVEDALIRRTLSALGMNPAVQGGGLEFETRSWRYLFSSKLALAGALGEMEEIFKKAQTIAGLPTPLRSAAMEKAAEPVKRSANPVVSRLFPALSRVFLRDAVAQMTWTLMRVATAIAWYESEKGQAPEKLEDLVPRYLPRVPACPLTGLPLGYRDGAVWSPGRNGVDDGGVPGRNDDADAEDGDVVWRVRRE